MKNLLDTFVFNRAWCYSLLHNANLTWNLLITESCSRSFQGKRQRNQKGSRGRFETSTTIDATSMPYASLICRLTYSEYQGRVK
ncbi:hypothetical protein VNO77_42671 [Canavalia gladiata]|uniref:Uncharacterized protein n=1 Tax=Canavalia gladiata TaxID=3824 RepID=A0AAN9JV57_CANGL